MKQGPGAEENRSVLDVVKDSLTRIKLTGSPAWDSPLGTLDPESAFREMIKTNYHRGHMGIPVISMARLSFGCGID